MKKFSEYKLEQYLRFPEELDESEKNEIERFIQSSEEAKKTFEWLKTFYSEYDKSTVHVIPLSPQPVKFETSGPVVLAAMSVPEKSVSGLETKATLVSEEHKTLVRVLEDRETETLQFHVLSRDQQAKKHAILSLAKPEFDLVTDIYGKLKNVKDLSDIDWTSVSAVLRVPVDRLELKADKKEAAYEVLDAKLNLKRVNGKLTLYFQQPDTGISRVLMIQGKTSILQLVEEKMISFDLPGDGNIALYFYE